MADRSESKKTVIECDCGTHMLQVQSEVDYYCSQSEDKERFHQEIYLAMFNYGNQKRNFFDRCVIAWKYLISGNMFSDQLCLNPDEAKKLATFITDNLIVGEQE